MSKISMSEAEALVREAAAHIARIGEALKGAALTETNLDEALDGLTSAQRILSNHRTLVQIMNDDGRDP